MRDPAPASWGAPPLTARPEGLLSVLGIQSGGRYPQYLLDQLQPTVDLARWYLEYNGTFRTATLNAAGFGVSGIVDTGLAVPDGELWIVNRASVTLDGVTWAAGGTALKYTGYLIRTNNANGTPLGVAGPIESPQVNALNAAYASCSAVEVPFILRPTVKLRYLWNGDAGITAGNIQIALAVTVARI